MSSRWGKELENEVNFAYSNAKDLNRFQHWFIRVFGEVIVIAKVQFRMFFGKLYAI